MPATTGIVEVAAFAASGWWADRKNHGYLTVD